MPNKDGSISERDFSQQVVDYARLRGWRVYRTWNSIHSPAGYPDLICLRGGRMVVAELKTAKGRTTREQEAWLDAFCELAEETRNVSVHLWRPADWQAIELVLGQISPEDGAA